MIIIKFIDFIRIIGVGFQIYGVYCLFYNVFHKLTPLLYEYKIFKIILEYVDKLKGKEDKSSKIYKDSTV